MIGIGAVAAQQNNNVGMENGPIYCGAPKFIRTVNRCAGC
jgi:hypothetical protein